MHPTDATTAGPRPSLRGRPTAELETSGIVSPLAALLKSSPASPGHRPPSDIYPSIWRLNPQCRLYHTLSKPRWRREALQLPLVSSAAAPKLTSSQLLSSTRRGGAKIVSFFTSHSTACAHARAESTAYRHQHDLPQMPSLKPSHWAVISARIRLGT